MSVEQTRRTLNQIDKDIAILEEKSVALGKREATARARAAQILKSIPKNASASTLRSKQAQIDRYNDEAIKAAKEKADIDKKIADKRKSRASISVKLQNEESIERKRADNVQKAIQQKYEKRIRELTAELSQRIPHSDNELINASNKRGDDEEYDVFISHAFEDKESFVDELVKELQSLGIKVWYDALNLKWGDSIRRKIDDGLKKSRFGIVVISKNYIKKFWTNIELDGLFQMENVNGKTILPIWHNISKKEVQDFSPTIAGKLALNTTMMNASEIAQELLKIPSPEATKNEMEDTLYE